MKDSTFHTSWKIEESEKLNSAALVSILLQASWYLLCYLNKKMMSNFLGSRRMMGMALLEQVDLQKRFLRYPSSFVYCAANKNRGLIIPLGLGLLEGLGT